jgi:hypothetical protein
MTVTAHLFVGADRPSTYAELATRMGVTHREAMRLVQEARLDGVAVVSGGRGLWLASNDAEALAWCERAHSRAIHQLETVKAVRDGVAARRAIGEQTTWLAA